MAKQSDLDCMICGKAPCECQSTKKTSPKSIRKARPTPEPKESSSPDPLSLASNLPSIQSKFKGRYSQEQTETSSSVPTCESPTSPSAVSIPGASDDEMFTAPERNVFAKHIQTKSVTKDWSYLSALRSLRDIVSPGERKKIDEELFEPASNQAERRVKQILDTQGHIDRT